MRARGVTGVRAVALAAVALAAVLSLFAGVAHAARPATAAEERAILKAAGIAPDSPGVKNGCVRPTVRVSGSYAFATFTFRNSSSCVRYAFNGWTGLRLVGSSWEQVFVGSEIPPCSVGLPPDLTPCQPMTALVRLTALGYERAVLSGDGATACSF